jgi:hypothetical protein
MTENYSSVAALSAQLGHALQLPGSHRPLHDIATEIDTEWSQHGSGVNYAARPYLDAMKALDLITDTYYADTARSMVMYFLANAGTWRGETARRVKDELKDMLKTV